MFSYYNYSKENKKNQLGATEGRFILFIIAVIFSAANITFELN
jgi:hypothetical protein